MDYAAASTIYAFLGLEQVSRQARAVPAELVVSHYAPQVIC